MTHFERLRREVIPGLWAVAFGLALILLVSLLGCAPLPESRSTNDVNIIEKGNLPDMDKVQWCITNAEGKVIQTVRANWTRVEENSEAICVYFREGKPVIKESYRVGVACWNYTNPLVVTKCPAYFKEEEDG